MKKLFIIFFLTIIFSSCRNNAYQRPYIISNSIEDTNLPANVSDEPQN